MLNRNSL
ncbi:hypothetical protein [Plasmodium yoelii yoelii]|nr:hypothetical protein [Plasmodium yoelii yoelii]